MQCERLQKNSKIAFLLDVLIHELVPSGIPNPIPRNFVIPTEGRDEKFRDSGYRICLGFPLI
jgi:hypothetical protein